MPADTKWTDLVGKLDTYNSKQGFSTPKSIVRPIQNSQQASIESITFSISTESAVFKISTYTDTSGAAANDYPHYQIIISVSFYN